MREYGSRPSDSLKFRILKKGPREGLLHGGFFLLYSVGVKTTNKEKLCQDYLADITLANFLEKCDSELSEKCRQTGCLRCQGKLHSAKYKRKPRGGPDDSDYVCRHSFCCAEEGCRKRHTPPSVRFLGHKVYWGIVVILVSAMRHGLKPDRVRNLCQSLGIDRRTLERWREWWLENFLQSPFWKAARARFTPPIREAAPALSLCQTFEIDARDKLLKLLHFLSPLSASSILLKRAL